MTKFTEMAKKETSVSRILENREKVSVEDIMHDYPTGVTIIDFDLVSLENTTFPVFAIAENPKVAFFGGTILNKIVAKWLSAYDGDLEECTADLRASGGVKVRLSKGKTKAGQRVILVDIIDG